MNMDLTSTKSETSDASLTFLKVSTQQDSYANTETLGCAIQNHCDDLVQLIGDKADDTVNVLSRQRCITQKERDDIMAMKGNNQRETNDRRARYLLSLMRGRSFETLLKFMDILKDISKDGKNLTQHIYSHYDLLRQKKAIDYVCAYCNIKQSVKLNELAGFLWQREQLSTTAHSAILESNGGHGKHAWDKLWKEYRTATHISEIQAYLDGDGLFTHLSKELQQQAKLQNYKIKCACSNAKLKKRFGKDRLQAKRTLEDMQSLLSRSTNMTQDDRRSMDISSTNMAQGDRQSMESLAANMTQDDRRSMDISSTNMAQGDRQSIDSLSTNITQADGRSVDSLSTNMTQDDRRSMVRQDKRRSVVSLSTSSIITTYTNGSSYYTCTSEVCRSTSINSSERSSMQLFSCIFFSGCSCKSGKNAGKYRGGRPKSSIL